MHNLVLSPISTDTLVEKIAKRTAEIITQSQPQQSQPSQAADEYGDIQRAAEVLNLTVPTIYTKVSRGELPGVCKRGKKLYFSISALKQYIKDGARKSNAEIEAEAKAYLSNRKK